MKDIKEALLAEFKEKSSLYITGKLSPLAFDDWFLEALSRYGIEVGGALPKCKKCFDKGFHTTLRFYEGYGEADMGQGDVHIFGQEPMYRLCDCDRGQEIDKLRKEYAREVVKEAVPEEKIGDYITYIIPDEMGWNACRKETLRRAEELLGK